MEQWKEASVRQRIRQMLESGALPCEEPDKVWAGHGNGSHCAACGENITQVEVEYEVQLASVTLRLHRECHEIWHDECQPRSPRVAAPV